MKKILVAGSSNVDFVMQVADMPKKGETVRAKSFKKLPGGKGANQACAVGKLGGSCVFLSVLGDDDAGVLLIDSLEKAGVNLDYICRDGTAPTGMAIITVDCTGENSITIVPGTNCLCDRKYFEKNARCLDEADIVLTQLETPVEDIYSLLIQAKKIGKITILNPAPAPDFLPDGVLKVLDCITPNETELEKLTGMKTDTLAGVSAAARTLLSRGVKNVIVTVGPQGALLCNAREERLFPALDAECVDTTAAGDTFNGALAVGFAEDMPLHKAIEFANAAASISVSRFGAQTSIPGRGETDRLLQTAGSAF